MRGVFMIFLIFTSALIHESLQQRMPIKTVVVLVMENRSFDHILGWMKRSVNPLINGVTGKECNPVSTKTPTSEQVCFTDDAVYVDPNPGHEFEDVRKQIFGSTNIPSMSGFVEQASTISTDVTNTVMKGFRPEQVPVYSALATEFAVFDRWFSSVPGPTQPNRLFVYSATSHGATFHKKSELAKGYPQKTIFDSLHENGLNFGIYFHHIPATLFYRNLRKLKYAFKFHRFSKFKGDAQAGKLPSLTVIEPRYYDLMGATANDDHPSHDVANGQKLVKDVYETLRESPQWNETLFLITYDEHGGFYDHVQTPYIGIPSPDGITGPGPSFFNFDRLGVRVPTIMVSPWIKKGTVISGAKGPYPNSEYEHSSIPATIKKIFNLQSPFLTRRDAWAGTFEHVVGGLSSPRTDCPRFLPNVAPLRMTAVDENRRMSSFQEEMVDLATVVNGEHSLTRFPDEMGMNMSVKEGADYVKSSVSKFIRASQQAAKLGAHSSAIVDMRPSLTTRSSSIPNA